MRISAAALIIGLLSPLPARADEPQRNGFTLELALGPGGIQDFNGERRHRAPGVAFAFGLGGFFDNSTALTLRCIVTQAYPDEAGRYLVVTAFLGPHLQYWLEDRWFVGAGAGFSSFFAGGLFSGTLLGDWLGMDDIELQGLGLSLRGGYSFASFENHSLRVTLELLPAFYGGGYVTMTESLTFEWQWF